MKYILILLLSITTAYCYGQLVNDGAIIKIQPGAYIFCGGNVENKNAGSISNDGKMEVQGNFLNTATYNSATSDDSLILSGGGNVTLNAGASTLNYLYINKTANNNFVTLTNNVTVTSKLIYNAGTLSTDPIANNYTLNAAISVPFQFTAGREIIGRVMRTGWANNQNIVFNQPYMNITTTGGTNPGTFTVNMVPQANGGDPSQNEREVKRKFEFTHTGGTGFTADISYPYLDAELNTNTEPGLVPWSLVTGEWNGKLSPVTRDGAINYITVNGITDTELPNEWKLADSKYTFNMTAYLKGAWNNPVGLMRTLLNTSNLLPLAQPFNTAPFNYAGTESVVAIPNANVVDWVLLDLRKPASGLPADATPATSIGKKAAFVLNDGSITDLDGVTPLAFDINKQGNGFFVIKTRNHLAIMSNSLPSNVTGSYTNNFSVLANNYKNPSATSDPVTLLAATGIGSTLYGMWPGDVNRNGSVTTSDVTPVNIAISGPVAGNTNVYNVRDVNYDRNVTTADVSVTNTSIAAFAQASALKPPPSTGIIIEKDLKSHVPGEGR